MRHIDKERVGEVPEHKFKALLENYDLTEFRNELIKELQISGKVRMGASTFLLGSRIKTGDFFQ